MPYISRAPLRENDIDLQILEKQSEVSYRVVSYHYYLPTVDSWKSHDLPMKVFIGFSWKTPPENFKIYWLQIHENAMKFLDHENAMNLQCCRVCHEKSMKTPWKIQVKPMKSMHFSLYKSLNGIQIYLIKHTYIQTKTFLVRSYRRWLKKGKNSMG